MYKKKFLIFFLLFSIFCFSQSKDNSDKEINDIISKSGGHLRNLECDKSLALAKKALDKAYKINNTEQIARSYNIIGLNLEEFNDYQKAIFFFNKGLEYAYQTNSDFIKYSLHTNIARTYCFHKINFKKGIYHYKMGLSYAKLLQDDYEIMYANLNITTAYFAINDYNSGLPYLNATKIAVNNSDELEAQITYNSLLGAYFTNKNKFIDAENAYKKAVLLCGKNKQEFLVGNAVEVYDDISRMYLKKGDVKKAYFYLEKHTELNQKLQEEKRAIEDNKSGLNAILNEYKRQIGQNELEKVLQKNKLEQARQLGILFIIIFLVLLLLVIVFYNSYLYKKKSNIKLVIAYRKLNKLNKQLTEVSNLKTQFISTVSHELRTPLYGVVGIADILVDVHPELTNSIYIDSLKFSANYLLSLINDILKINKIENKNIKLEHIKFNIFDKMDSILSTLKFVFNRKQNEIIVNIDSEIPKYIIGDNIRLSQIIINLLSNSLKFTSNGKVFLTLKLVKKTENSVFIEFEVKDTGIGILPEDQTNIFETFVQLNRNDENHQGSGLGLSIVQKLIELFNSEIHLQSEFGKGTTINFTIEFETVPTDDSDFINTDDLLENRSLKVLIVEDNKINQLITKKILEKNNFDCQVVGTGFDALETLKATTFDVILMDINMPGMDGFETTMNIRKSGITIPIIALTAFSKHEVEEKALNSGINAIVIKPYQPEELYGVIKSLINNIKNAD